MSWCQAWDRSSVGLRLLVVVFSVVAHRPHSSGEVKFEMADRRDWSGGGDDPEESTQRMIQRIWESLIDIRRRMDQQAPVPPVAVPPGDGETEREEGDFSNLLDLFAHRWSCIHARKQANKVYEKLWYSGRLED
ncbi:hypothetical protein Taro_046425 [Colocasia esculenta]|uniref:Uncharacterized protein n=1 Tax=Colocasia esculenta TaxID=4460 RepID=A0A843WZ57_COLES|nr:hypothetical protein [Colocasia esculenta]